MVHLECLAEDFSESNLKGWACYDNDIWTWNCCNHLVLTLPQLSCLSCDISPPFDNHWQQTNYYPICNHDVERIIMSPNRLLVPADILQFFKGLGCLPLHQMEFLPIKLVQPGLYGHSTVYWFALVCTASTTLSSNRCGCGLDPSFVEAVFLPRLGDWKVSMEFFEGVSYKYGAS